MLNTRWRTTLSRSRFHSRRDSASRRHELVLDTLHVDQPIRVYIHLIDRRLDKACADPLRRGRVVGELKDFSSTTSVA